MTSIKPPSTGPQGPHTLPDTSDISGGVSRSDAATGGSFQATLEQANQAHQAGALSATGGGTPTAGADPLAQLAQAIEAGKITVDQAVEELLGHTLSRAQKQLSAPQLAELSGLLRDALLSDPTLSALRNERR